MKIRNSPLEVLLEKGVVKICSKFSGEQPCRSAILIKLQSKFAIQILKFYNPSTFRLLTLLKIDSYTGVFL